MQLKTQTMRATHYTDLEIVVGKQPPDQITVVSVDGAAVNNKEKASETKLTKPVLNAHTVANLAITNLNAD